LTLKTLHGIEFCARKEEQIAQRSQIDRLRAETKPRSAFESLPVKWLDSPIARGLVSIWRLN
jgi:hypothetical protein